MDVHLTDEQKAFIREAIAAGRLHREEDAVKEALALWEERERARLEILAAVDLAEASLSQGKGRTVATREGTRQLADDVKRRGISRLTAERNNVR
jgi:Arc/MetJ-type ribon-helix-helix transcriptional regulator